MALPRECRLGALFLVAGIATATLYFLFPSSGTAQAAIYDTIGGFAVVGILWGIRTYQPRPVRPWIVFAVGNALFVAGDAVVDLYPNATSPSAADVLYLSAYPLFALSVVMMLIASEGHRSGGTLVDAGIVTLAFAVFQWIFVMQPAIHGDGTLSQKIIYGLHPAMDIVLLSGYASFFGSPAWRTPAFMLLVAGFVAQLVGDEAVGLSTARYQEGRWVDFTWMLSYVFWGAAALIPSMKELTVPRRVSTVLFSRWRVGVLAGALLTVPIALVVAHARGDSIGIYEVSALAAAITLLVVSRLSGVLRTMERIRMRERNARWLAEDTQKLLADQNERLLEADRLKDEFVALISHDLRTPLTSIIGYVELALDASLSPTLDKERRGYLQIVARNSDRLVRLVDDLLFVARVQAGRLILEPAELDLSELVRQAVDEARPRAEQGGLEMSFDANGPVLIEGDRGRLSQLLDNLISNALKFTHPGGRVELRVESSSDGVLLDVNDTGIGLPPGDTERIFERFFRTRNAVAEQIPGTGLGLFIARAIAEAHGGSISASSRAEGGTTFRILLPLRAESTVDPDAAELLV
ncbi:MAG TPA: HAMP domain-containing sensor histidine kinase [Gaiellaceae bacterium]|nr:HAMP domain-containing sensor histidine kinase [Gaiellaceae bacterium]